MTEENDSLQQKSAWPLPKINCMSTSLQHRQAGCLPAAQMFSVSASMPGFSSLGINHDINTIHDNQALPVSFVPYIPSSKMRQVCEAKGLQQNSWHCFPNLSSSAGLYLKEKKSGLAMASTGKTKADALSGSLPKGFLIFDKSGSQTRLVYSSFYPPAPHAIAATAKLASDNDFHDGVAFKSTLVNPMQLSLGIKSNENQIGIEENEMQEDTEEINALLYSDEEDDSGYDDHDEIMSTGHSPVTIKRCYQKLEQGEEIIEEVGSYDGGNKRQKKLKGTDMESSLSDTASSLNLEVPHQCDMDVESSHTFRLFHGEETDCVSVKKPSKKGKVQRTLKILENMVPGAKGKGPLLVLDKAIDYLKTLKLEAKSFE